ncbi:MAG: 4-hydroxy-tetrahydrodipicolinate synthase [Candidatus Eremiobacteraeota bacterium]|nr:4-hydroxy-tetrahydrodipicolinate synthase [Candidatus Eremiobacteraeota bacterium]
MKKLKNNPFGSLITAVVTPFKETLAVDYEKAASLAKKLIQEGNDGLVVAGTTGESPTLSHEEKIQLFKTIKQAVGAEIPVIAGTGNNSTQGTIALTQEAESLGMDGALVVCPYYNKPPQEGLYQHFKKVAENTKLPLIIYNIPGRTGINMLPETVERLAAVPNIIGIKEASGSVEQVSEISRRISKSSTQFFIWSGDDGLTLPFLSCGAIGVISVAAHLAAGEMKEMIQSFFEGKVEKALEIHLHLLPLFKALFMTTNPIPVKAALKLTGFPVGGLRPPLVEASEKEIRLLEEALEAIKNLPSAAR